MPRKTSPSSREAHLPKPVFYGRVSSLEQQKGETIESQLYAWRQHVAVNNLPTSAPVLTDEAFSGALELSQRPSGNALLELCRAGKVDTVYVWKLDRLGRDAADTVNVAKFLGTQNIRLRSLTEGFESGTPQGDFVLGMYAHVAQLERQNIIERTTEGRKRKVRQGLWVFGDARAPYGYRVQDHRLVVHHEEALVCLRIAQLRVLERLGYGLLSKRLAQEGLLTREGQRWPTTSLRKICTLPTYRGTLELGHSGGKPSGTVGPCPAIFGPETAAALDALELRGKSRERQDYPLSNTLRCARCGARMQGEPGKRYRYYRCTSHTLLAGACGARTLRAEVLESLAWDSLLEFLSIESLERWVENLLEPEPEPGRPDPAALRATLEEERKRIIRMYSRGNLSDDEYDELTRDLSERLSGLSSAPSTAPTREQLRGARDRALLIAEGLRKTPLELRGEYLRSFLERASAEAAEASLDRRGRTQTVAYQGNGGERDRLYVEGMKLEFVWSLESLLKGD